MTDSASDRREPRPPSSAELIQSFEAAESCETTRLLDGAWRLARQHLQQWAMEDQSRDQAASDEAVAAAKHAMDQLNTVRVDLIAAIDMWAATHLPSSPRSTPHTESLGFVIDRLAVAWVRKQRFVDRAAASGTQDDGSLASLAARQLEELGCAYDHLIRDVR